MIAWEAVALSLARDAGITVPEFELHRIAGRPSSSRALIAELLGGSAT